MNRLLMLVGSTVVAVLVSAPVRAQVPTPVTFAMELDQNGAPASDIFTVVLDIFDAPVGGTLLVSQTEPSLAVTDGELIVDIDSLTDVQIAGGALFVSITVNGDALSPRVPINSGLFTRFSHQADDADTVAGLSDQDISALTTATGGLARTGATISIAPGGVQAAHLAPGAVTDVKIASGAVLSAKIANGAVTAASNALDQSSVDGNVLQDGSVTGAKIASDLVGADFKSHGITHASVAPGAITGTELAANAVDTSKVLDGSLRAADVAASSKTDIFTVTSASAAHCPTQGPTGAFTTSSTCSGCGSATGCVPATVIGCTGNVGFKCLNTPVGSLIK